jgi:hypothetical protein
MPGSEHRRDYTQNQVVGEMARSHQLSSSFRFADHPKFTVSAKTTHAVGGVQQPSGYNGRPQASKNEREPRSEP